MPTINLEDFTTSFTGDLVGIVPVNTRSGVIAFLIKSLKSSIETFSNLKKQTQGNTDIWKSKITI